MRRLLILFAAVLLLWTLVVQADHTLARLHLSLFAGGLFIADAALTLPGSSGLAVALFAGAICDANSPVPFGTHLFLFAGFQTALSLWRDRLPRDEVAGRVVVALFANLGIFLALSFFESARHPAAPSIWGPLIVDLIFSQAFVAAVAPWFFALQERALDLFAAGP